MDVWYQCENPYPFVPQDVLDSVDSVRGSLPNRYCDPRISADLFEEVLDECGRNRWQYVASGGGQLIFCKVPDKVEYRAVPFSEFQSVRKSEELLAELGKDQWMLVAGSGAHVVFMKVDHALHYHILQDSEFQSLKKAQENLDELAEQGWSLIGGAGNMVVFQKPA